MRIAESVVTFMHTGNTDRRKNNCFVDHSTSSISSVFDITGIVDF